MEKTTNSRRRYFDGDENRDGMKQVFRPASGMVWYDRGSEARDLAFRIAV